MAGRYIAPPPFGETERTCPICGKEFFINGADWAYKRRDRHMCVAFWFCSWKCLRRYDSGTAELNGRGNKMTRRDKILQACDDGLNDREIAAILGITPTAVKYNRDKYWTPKEKKED